jgi:hypothetical protein
MGFRSERNYSKEGFQTVLGRAGETETTQYNIQDWLSWMKETLDFSFFSFYSF